MNIKIMHPRYWVMGSASLLLGLGFLQNVQADGIYTPKAVLNQQAGERLQVFYQGAVGQAADLFLAAQINQQLLFFTEQGDLSALPVPFLHQNSELGTRTLIDLDSTQIPAGRYQVYQVLTRANGDVFNTGDWIGSLHSVNFIVGENQDSHHDYDHDGFSDDDADHDGYHDNDHDRDGYSDPEHDGENTDAALTDTPVPPAPPTPPNSAAYPDGARLLASQCFQCHGTEGVSISGIDSLREESDEIASELFEMKYENKNEIMHLHAKGYSDDEIRRIDAYFRALYGVNP